MTKDKKISTNDMYYAVIGTMTAKADSEQDGSLVGCESYMGFGSVTVVAIALCGAFLLTRKRSDEE